MGKTQNFGFNKFGAEGRLSDEGYKFTLKDRELMDAIFWTLANHDHRATSASVLEGPTGTGVYLDTTLITTSGTLPAGRTYYYKFSYVDSEGNETQASAAIAASTPNPIIPPESQSLSTATTGGSLSPGTYKYALAFYQDAGGVTTAPNESTITIPTGTNTNTVTIPLPTLADGADGWKLYRKAPGEVAYYLLATIASGPTDYTDDGSVNPDCTTTRPQSNTTNSTNSIQLDIPAIELPLDSRVVSWRIYRTRTAGLYSANSLVATVADTTTEGGADLVTTYTDVGEPLNVGVPLGQTAIPPVPPQLDAGDIFKLTGKPLPSELAPRGVRSFNLQLPGTLVAQTYHQFVPPHDMYAERIDAFFLTAPTGLAASTDFVTVRFSDDDTQNEIQSLYNDATTQNEIQQLYNDATSGTFTLSDGTDTTSAINYDADAATIETRLETDITAYVDVTATGTGTVNDPWVITFIDPGNQNIAQMTVDDTNMTGGTSTITTTIEGSDGGTFTLSDGTDTTSAMPYNETAANIETRLETDITSITDVIVTGTGIESDPWVIEFVDPGSQNVDTLIVDDTNLNGTSSIEETTRGYGITQVDLVIDQNQQAHFWQSSTTDSGTQEAEDAPARGGTQVSDTLALNDSAMELDAQNEANWWQVGTLEEGDYSFFFYVSDNQQAATFDLEVNELTSEVQELYNNSTTGDFTISFTDPLGTYTTNAIAYNAANTTVETELEALAGINAVTVTGAGTSGDPWVITFDNPAGDVNQITTDDAGMDGTSTITTTTAGTSTTLDSLSVSSNRAPYEPAYELLASLDGTQIVEMRTIKTDAETTDTVRVDKYEYEVNLPVLHGGSTVTAEVLIAGTPTTNGDDLNVALWY